MTIGFGIIGCGMISRFHARAIGDIKGTKLVACYSATPSSADKFAAEQNCTAYHSLHELLKDSAVDIVTICTPSGAHLEPCIAAAKAGKHVICEKPLDITFACIDKMIVVCDKVGVILFTIFLYRRHSFVELQPFVRYRDWWFCVDAGMTNIPGERLKNIL